MDRSLDEATAWDAQGWRRRPSVPSPPWQRERDHRRGFARGRGLGQLSHAGPYHNAGPALGDLHRALRRGPGPDEPSGGGRWSHDLFESDAAEWPGSGAAGREAEARSVSRSAAREGPWQARDDAPDRRPPASGSASEGPAGGRLLHRGREAATATAAVTLVARERSRSRDGAGNGGRGDRRTRGRTGAMRAWPD